MMDSTARERIIIEGLACEWDLAVNQLAPSYQGRLRRPLLRLAALRGKLGQWLPAKREICLDRALVFDHPWDAVRDVLRHETAHQLADTLLGGDDQPPHGPAFQQACLLLRADPAPAASRIPLQVRMAAGHNDAESRLRRRVHKLLALARSHNPFEAEAAMLKAHELMARHQIGVLRRGADRTYISVFLGRPALRHFKEVYFLANLLQDFFFVQCIWISTYVVSKAKLGRALEASGLPVHVEQADYAYAFIMRHIDLRWEEFTQGRRFNRYRKSDFAVGVIEGFRAKLTRQRLPGATAAERALIVQGDPRLALYLQHRYPHTTNIQRGGGRQDPEVYDRGHEIGQALVLHEGLTQAPRQSKRKLPAP